MPTNEEIADLGEKSADLVKQLARLLYHPACTVNFSGAQDIHPKHQLTVGFRSKVIDDGIRALIEKLWNLEIETTGCCENHAGGQAYVQFACAYMSTPFVSFLDQLHIPFQTHNEDITWNINGITIVMESRQILFPANSIDALTAAIPNP